MNHFLGPGYNPSSVSTPPAPTLVTLLNTIDHLTNDVKHHLPKSVVDLAERIGRDGPSTSILDTSVDASRLDQVERRIESLQHQITSATVIQAPPPMPQSYVGAPEVSEDLHRLEVALTGGLSETDR